MTVRAKGEVLLPRHCSCELKASQLRKKSTSVAQSKRPFLLVIQCNRPGPCWRGLYPLLFLSPSPVAKRAMRILPQTFLSRAVAMDDYQSRYEEIAINQSHFSRTFKSRRSYRLYVRPPLTERVDYDFSGRLIQFEHMWLQGKTLSAWYATLGGGYFLCRQLSTAALLARRQRHVAEWMSDWAMADRCTLNEAYNYLYAGHFEVAFQMLNKLRTSAREREDVVLYNMTKSAYLFGKRMKRAGKRHTTATASTVDDYQRIRIVKRM